MELSGGCFMDDCIAGSAGVTGLAGQPYKGPYLRALRADGPSGTGRTRPVKQAAITNKGNMNNRK